LLLHILFLFEGPQFSAAVEFRVEPWNLTVATEFPCFYGLLKNLVKRLAINVIADLMT